MAVFSSCLLHLLIIIIIIIIIINLSWFLNIYIFKVYLYF